MSTPRNRKTTKKVTPKKMCQSKLHDENTSRERAYTYFFKVDSPMFPDGMINICRDCVRKEVDIDDMDSVISFLRQIDKPFIQKYWDEASKSDRYTLGEYIRKINSLQQLKDKTFDSSDGFNGLGKVKLATVEMPDTLENVKGEVIELTDALVQKWGNGYEDHELLQMEKFYQDMRLTHEIHTPVHVKKLMSLSKLTIKQDRLIEADDWANVPKIAKTIEDMEKNAGFRPVDRQGIDDATGIKSFSQIFEEVEKRGFRKPPAIKFEEDIVDAMIVSLANYYHRLVGSHILKEIPEEIKAELDNDDFYEFDGVPVELNDEEYDDLDFSVEDDEEDDEDGK